jgi:hypothetical protein
LREIISVTKKSPDEAGLFNEHTVRVSGCAIVMVQKNQAQAVSEKITATCLTKGIKPEFLAVTPAAGAELI